MKLNYVRPHKSITGSVSNDELANFIVLSGLNGAGKSNLLEAIQHGAVVINDIVDPSRQSNEQGSPIRLFSLGQFGSQGSNSRNSPNTVMGFWGSWTSLQSQVYEAVETLTKLPNSGFIPGSDELETAVIKRLTERKQPLAVLQNMTKMIGKRLIDFTSGDFQASTPLIPGMGDPFAMNVERIFLSYQARYERNELAQARREKGRPGGEAALTDDEFSARFGAPPWFLLDEILAIVGLDYHMNYPVGAQESVPFSLRLIHNATDEAIEMTSLSSGERTLMGIAMSLYAGAQFSDSIELPKVLLLDEPDASLHPAMTRELLRVADDIFHKRYGVKVILATHSPSTVALAPENSLYTIRRTGYPRLRRAASRDDALTGLMVGLPTLSIRNDNRRQVIVESDDDENCYNELFRFLKDMVESPISLDFVASGRGGQGGVDEAVRLVRSLRNSGNLVRGLIDRDDRQAAPTGIEFLKSRRALENLVLDPLLVGVFLLREHYVRPEVIAGDMVTHFQLRQQHAQAICDYVTQRVLQPDDDQTAVVTQYLAGFKVTIPSFYFNINGHLLEQRLFSSFPELLKYPKNLKIKIIEYILTDTPLYAPKDVIDLFNQLASVAS